MNICKTARYAVASFCVTILFPFAASGSPPDATNVPENAKWVIHLDLEALAKTALVQEVREERPHLAQIVQRWLQNRYGINPREDLDSLTMFSDTYEAHTGTMILKANYEPEKVKAALEERPDVQKESWENHTLYTVAGKQPGFLLRAGGGASQQAERQSDAEQPRGKPMNIILLDAKTVIFASSPDRAKAAVKFVQGGSPRLAADSPLFSHLKEETMIYGAAIDLGEIEQRDGIFPVLSQHEKIYWTVRKAGDEVLANLTLHAQSEEVAEQMKTALEGSVAFGKVWAADSENLKKLMENRQVSRDGQTVEFTGRGDSQTVLEAIGELRERFQQRFQTTTN